MPIRLAALVLAVFVVFVAVGIAPARADTRPRIEKAADLPRFTYRIDGKAEDVVRDASKFAPFAAAVQHDIESVLDRYEIDDHATLRQLEGELAVIDYLAGDRSRALARLARVRALQDKPAGKWMSGLEMRAMIEAEAKTGNTGSAAYRDETGKLLDAALAAMPYEIVQNEVREAKARSEIASEALILGYIRTVIQPTIDKAGGLLSSDLAPALIGARYRILALLPLKPVAVRSFENYLAAHHVVKPDIWAARDVALAPGKPYHRVNVAIWDSGVDLSLFPGRVVEDESAKPAVIAFDRYSRPAKGDLQPIPAELRDRIPQLKARLKGFSDLQSNIDSPEASAVKQYLSSLKPDQYQSTVESLSLSGNWIHGTHVAGIAVAGNPYARIVVGRIEFDWHLLPDPCPSRELALRDAKNAMAYVDFFRRHHVRVVNMSWGGSVKGVEEALEMCNLGKDSAGRKALARDLFDIQKDALKRAFESAPEILFVTAAGNSNQNASFAEAIPADLSLPNLITVGAVDQAGDEASFTSYGPTVVVDANGYQVESVIPGGEKLAESGTSMAAPQVTNLAAKMLAVDPRLTPRQIIAVIRITADTTSDGRRNLIDPRKALARVTPAA